MKLSSREIFDRLVVAHGEAVSGLVAASDDPVNKEGAPRDAFCACRAGDWLAVARTLIGDPALAMDSLQCVTAVDLVKQSLFQMVYHLYSYTHRHAFVVKLELPRAEPVAPSVSGVWSTANWQEREQYDLFGVRFEGHPDLRRLLMPDDWEGHPMRKDYKEGASYRGMPTTREGAREKTGSESGEKAAP